MSRRFCEPILVIASHNAGKVREITALLAPFGVQVRSIGEFSQDVPAETENSFFGNAAIKSHAAAKATGLPALADDSGLEIAVLGGAPGVHSADWAETETGRDFEHAMARVWREICASHQPAPHHARFVCCLSLAWPDGHEEAFLGEIAGTITWPPRGDHGFGYDPIFVPRGQNRTFAELEPAYKQAHSHRADAFAKLIAGCFGDAPGD